MGLIYHELKQQSFRVSVEELHAAAASKVSEVVVKNLVKMKRRDGILCSKLSDKYPR